MNQNTISSNYLAKDSPERWILNLELDSYFEDKDVVFDVDDLATTGD